MLEYDVACIPEPKLHPFDTGGEPLQLEFIKKLGDGIHSYVWKVRINGNLYALKMFTPEQDPATKAFDDRGGIEGHAARWPYFHAFPKEYRAFARLKEFGQEHLAVTCYGWIELDESHYEFMDRHIDRHAWSGDFYGKMKRYAIVKELLDFKYPFCHHEDMARVFVNRKLAKKMFNGLKTMHNLGIFVGDIKHDNISWGNMSISAAPGQYLTPLPLIQKLSVSRDHPIGTRSTSKRWCMGKMAGTLCFRITRSMTACFQLENVRGN
ncbi:uncharacterized protein PG998_010037 [Apiospora kogelbergensis]|uniref:uncharacterized protein n=1 Tax=Apiospora kogelbergensis TaxID=1337665 RepID=UPI00312F6759